MTKLEKWMGEMGARLKAATPEPGRTIFDGDLIRDDLPRLLGLVRSAMPILSTVAYGDCIWEDIHGIKCELPWPEGPDGKAPDGGPACEPCRAKAWLAQDPAGPK